jgi:DNA helicase-2/ATP-dependent DNA helicase PcrA
LRRYAPLLGYTNSFTVLDSDDSEQLLKICIKEVKPSDVGKRFPSAAAIGSVLSYSRNANKPLVEVIERKYPFWLNFLTEIERIANDFSARKKSANAMDFDDLLINFLLLLNDPKIAQIYQNQFKYILVDEYQDTNIIQAQIIKKLSLVHNNVLVVGDDAQSIYSFRAAAIENILKFDKEYPGAKIFKLETNYRSSKEILDLANNVIENNRDQFKKQLRTVLQGAKPELHPQLDQQSEGEFVADRIEMLIKNGTSPKKIAVLFRAAYHSQMLEVELVKRGIQYDYRGGVRFFERSHIKDILSYLRILTNIADTAAWLRVLMHEEGIGPVAAQKLIAALKGVDKKDVEAIGREVLTGRSGLGFNNFLMIWNKLLSAPIASPTALIDIIITSPYKEYLETEFVDSRDRMQDIKQLAVFSEEYEDVSDFLGHTTLQESFVLAPKGQNASDEKIILTTIHQAKGLEWDAVFVINLASGAFPSDRSMKEDGGIEEERRLFYVAITRARQHLYLSYPMAGGSFGDFLSGPSMFLNEIDPVLLDDHSILSVDTTVLDDDIADVHYISEDKPKIRPGSFLADIHDL